ncbi:hypothetical protein MNBD_GAMMA24-1127 [hydrothermal vent metagenome]|uniref:Lipoprotein n=1 Tax=hydrothermal vent metagenome TaxID=652676 RepID=A0A3B1B4P8_9ZZZZ
MRHSKLLILLATVVVLSACGGGNVAVTPVPTTTQSTPTAEVTGLNGIWEGDYTDSSGTVCTDVKGLTYNGSVRVISEKCNLVLAGTLSVNGGNANIDFDLFDTTGVGAGQSVFSGSFTQKSSIDGSLDNGGRLSLRYQTVYENDSSLTYINSRWVMSDGKSLYFFTVDIDGSIASQAAPGGCNYTGSISIIDTQYDLYGIDLTVKDCSGNYAARNGNFSGIGALLEGNKIFRMLVGNAQTTFFVELNNVSVGQSN